MKILRTSMTPRKTVSCLNVYLPCCSDTLQAPKICAVVHTSLLQKVHNVSVVIEARQKRSKVSWHCHQSGPREVLLNIVHPSCPLTLNLQLDSFGEGIGVIN